MKKSKLLVSCAVAGMLLGSQAALADHHKKDGKTEEGKNGCKGKNSCKGKKAKDEKHTCKTAEGKKEEGKGGCEGKEEEKKEEE